MKLGMIGLGKMGEQMVARLLEAGHEVVVTDRDPAAVERSVTLGAVPAADRSELVHKLDEKMVIWLMIPASAVDAELAALTALLPPESIIIDGGNSHYSDTMRRAADLESAGARLIDVGTSGGVLGREGGFSMMIGGDAAAVEQITPIITALARPNGWAHFGPVGSGHFIKMVHNGIEYGLMEAYAEGYHVLHQETAFGTLDLAKIAAVWEEGSIVASRLNALTGEVLSANPELTGIDGIVAESGEAQWTIEAARALKVEVTVIEASLAVRKASHTSPSFATKLLAAMRHGFGGHALNVPNAPEPKDHA